MPEDKTLHKLESWQQESKSLLTQYHNRWARNLRLVKGIFADHINIKSKVRNVEKDFHRKIWASNWRLTASFYNAFLRDPDNFRIEGRDIFDDPRIAKVLQRLVEYRRDRLMRRQSLFLKFIDCFQNIINFGWAPAKLTWEFNEDRGIDEPNFIPYEPEQAFPDLSAVYKEKMRYMVFLNYMTRTEMEALDYENINKCEETGVDSNPVRDVRHMGTTDPLQNPDIGFDYQNPRGGEYPEGGRFQDNEIDREVRKYRVYECFWWEDDEPMFGVTCDFKVWLREPGISPYGEYFPVIMGTCLREAHKMIGEGFPQPLEAPQESYNYNLNMRKDNIALALNRQKIVNKFGEVDLQSLMKNRAGGVVMANDINAVDVIDTPDVTQSAYVEAGADDAMMQEISGITAGKLGREAAEKATVARINFSESNAKIDLYIALVSETFVRDFYSMLADQVQRFETDELSLRIANDQVRQELPEDSILRLFDDVADLGIEADAIVNVGLGTTGRDLELQQSFLAMDRAIMSNQSMLQLAQLGIVTPQSFLINTSRILLEDIFPKIGKKNIQDYMIPLANAQQEGAQNPALAGQAQPQLNNEQNTLQAGGFGGL